MGGYFAEHLQFDLAEENFSIARSINRAIPHAVGEATVLAQHAQMVEDLPDIDRAIAMMVEAMELFDACGLPKRVQDCQDEISRMRVKKS